MLAVFEKEFKSYFRSGIGAVFIGLFLLVSAGILVFTFLMNGVIAYPSYLSYLNIVLMITIPIITMRSLSEERKSKTDQLLLTSPIKASDIALGKYLAAVAVLFITLLLHSIDAIVISFFAINMYALDILVAYIGLFLVGCAYIAIGVFISSTTTNQVISAIVTFAVMLVLFILQWLSTSVTSDVTSGIVICGVVALGIVVLIYSTTKNKVATLCTAIIAIAGIAIVALINANVYAGLLNTMLSWFSVIERLNEFFNGSVSISSFIYIISLSFVFVYMTVYQIEKRRWVG